MAAADDMAGGGVGQSTVFFSYSREDQPQAVPIIRQLEAAGFVVWWDGLLEGGERFSRATEDALNRAKAVVVLWSKVSVQSHWVHDEATRGRDRGVLVPLSLDGTEPPLGFGQFQVISLAASKVGPHDAQIRRLNRAVAALHDGRAVAAPPAAPAVMPAIGRRAAIGGGLAVAAAGGGALLWQSGLLGTSASDNSIAVLPFTNLSGDPAQSYFSDGLASEIRAQLSRNPLLQTAGQTSSNQFRDASGDTRSVARKLRVSFLLQGNVQKMGDQLKVVTSLDDGATGTSVWSEIFERKLSDVFAVQSEIAGAVTQQLSAVMDSRNDGRNDSQVGGTASLAAFDTFLRGRDLFEAHIDEASERAALAQFDSAIALDPNYAAARAARARSLAVIANQFADTAERKALYAQAVDEARRATTLAPTFAPGFAALGYALFYGRLDAAAAKPAYDRAFALTQSDVDVIARYAVYCVRTGRNREADAAIQRAAALDPLNPTMFKSAGNIKYAAGDYGAAIEYGRKALALAPTRSTLRGDIGNAMLMQGKIDEAEAEFAAETNNLLALPGRAIMAHKRGQAAGVKAALAALVTEFGDNGLYQQAQILAQSGQADAAFAALDKAWAATDSGLVYLRSDPFLVPLQSDARYNGLLRKLKFV